MFFGNNYNWFEGVVEDRFDPLRLGRVRVRVMGIHTDQKSKNREQGIPTEELLWMHPLLPITSSSMSGIGDSPTGLVEGSHVVGYFRDQFCQDGVVVGSLPGIYKHKPNNTRGFSDPSGTYPRYIGNDVNILAGGGQAGSGDVTGAPTIDNVPFDIKVRNDNAAIAVNADLNTEYIADDDPNFTIEEMLKQDEGVKYKWYLDSELYPTIGIGHLIIKQKITDANIINGLISKLVGRVVTNGTITEDEVSKLFADDLYVVRSGILSNSRLGNIYGSMSRSRQMAIENMCFQMGVGGLLKFNNTLSAMEAQDWKSAYTNLRQSLWASQTPGRSGRVSKIILSGNLESYGIANSTPEPEVPLLRMSRMSTRLQSTQIDIDDPEQPPPKEDKKILFTEPKVEFSSQYPYNHVYESEGGHIEEFDDTPSKERYHRKHPIGTFEEIQPDGTRVVKIIGDDYLIVQKGRNVNIKGNLQVVIEGDSTVYCMGNSIQTIDGNVNQMVKGNVTEHVEGNITQTVTGNSIQTIKGDVEQNINGTATQIIDGVVNQTIKSDCYQQIDGNYQSSISGNYNMTVSGTYNVSANITTISANGTATISGSTIILN